MVKKYYKNIFLKKLLLFYKKYMVELYFCKDSELYTSFLTVTLPNRQHYLSLYSSNESIFLNAGLVVGMAGVKLKYYKRSVKSNTSLILTLLSLAQNNLRYLYLYLCYNFTYRHWIFLQKLYLLVEPSIFFFQHSKSYNTYYRPVKRLKKKIVKILNKI